MTIYARVIDGVVLEIIQPVDADDGVEVPIADRFAAELVETMFVCGEDVGQGWTYDGTTFAAPVQAPAPSVDYVTVNASQQVSLMTTANAVTFGMADAYVAGLLDDADAAKFKAWAAYKLALSKVDLTKAEPVWPTVPAT